MFVYKIEGKIILKRRGYAIAVPVQCGRAIGYFRILSRVYFEYTKYIASALFALTEQSFILQHYTGEKQLSSAIIIMFHNCKNSCGLRWPGAITPHGGNYS